MNRETHEAESAKPDPMAELLTVSDRKLELWRYYSDRADKFSEQLWTTGTWLFGIVTTVLALPFFANFIEPDPKRYLRFESRLLTIVIYFFGILLCAFSYVA